MAACGREQSGLESSRFCSSAEGASEAEVEVSRGLCHIKSSHAQEGAVPSWHAMRLGHVALRHTGRSPSSANAAQPADAADAEAFPGEARATTSGTQSYLRPPTPRRQDTTAQRAIRATGTGGGIRRPCTPSPRHPSPWSIRGFGCHAKGGGPFPLRAGLSALQMC